MRVAICLILTGSLLACAPRDPKRKPEDAVAAMLEAMERLDQAAFRARAFELLDARSREVLEARARTAESLSHRPFTGPDMLVPSRAILAFTPERIEASDVEIEGDRARVTVRGSKPGEVAQVPLVREADGWHLSLRLEHEASEAPEPEVLED